MIKTICIIVGRHTCPQILCSYCDVCKTIRLGGLWKTNYLTMAGSYRLASLKDLKPINKSSLDDINLYFSGHSGHASLHEDFELVLWQHLFPHDHWQLSARIETALRNVARIQDGRPPDVIHIADAYQHEQTTLRTSEVNAV